MADFFDRANPNDAYDLREVFRIEREHVDEVAELLLAAWWARFDPQTALARRMHPHWSGRHPWIETVVREWARAAPESALQAVAEMDKQRVEPHQAAVRSLIRGWFEGNGSDPTPLLDVIDRSPIGPQPAVDRIPLDGKKDQSSQP